ncbi:hypothetical protein P3T36_004686 [Kitasatospora sp. MAP12-15]|uniref:hypothetical protein n=1 Tax=unclassified Kitasatospora TaxID=2633591 RepID=UPI0024754BB3|nr:hypothetical protein [Kitasatospora sp. MAP12-44]MDH6111532.1 hypothetical protein [Kitasatospora sp. MAP12-44]
MLVTFSTALIFFIITVVLVWARRLSLFGAFAAWLSGFTAAATAVAGPVHSLLATLTSAFH